MVVSSREIAARAHVRHMDKVVRDALVEAGLGFDDLDGIAATAGPGVNWWRNCRCDDRQSHRRCP